MPKKSEQKAALAVIEQVEDKIYVIRGQRVMLDSDLAEIYAVETRRLKEQVRRNIRHRNKAAVRIPLSQTKLRAVAPPIRYRLGQFLVRFSRSWRLPEHALEIRRHDGVAAYFAGSQGPVRTVRLRWSMSGFSNPA